MNASMILSFERDINDPLITFCPATLLARGDQNANIIRLTVMDGNAPADISGNTAVVLFQRPGDSYVVRCPGSVSGNVISVTLLGDCYLYAGQYYASLILDADGFTRTMLRLAGQIESNGDGPIIDPTGTIPGYEDIARIYAELEASLGRSDAATDSANTAAQNANEKAALANKAAGNANAAADSADEATIRANEASESIEGLTVEASDVAYNKPATATVTDVEGHKHIAFGLRQGNPGEVPNITFTVQTGAPGTDVVLEQSGTPDAPIVDLTIPRGDTGDGDVNSVDGVSPNAQGNVSLSAVCYAAQTLQPAQQQQALTNISGVGYVSQTLTDEQQQQARANIGAQALLVHNYTYDGRDLSQRFTAAELHQKVSAGDFSGIQNGDYWPITLSGTIKDYASGETKTINNVVLNLEANIQVYQDYGDIANVPNHILFCSRELLPWTLQMRSADTTWYNAREINPWRGSHLFQTLNAEDGLLPLVAATDIGAYMYAGPNGAGMRFLLENQGVGASAASDWIWADRGKLFLPTEREVWGADVWSNHTWGSGSAVQWPLFASSMRHAVKRMKTTGSRLEWWCQSSFSGSDSYFVSVSSLGNPRYSRPEGTWVGAPLCFLLV